MKTLRSFLAALIGAALILAPMPALPAEVYTACVIGKAKAELRSLGYGRNATAETNLQIADSATRAALRHCRPLPNIFKELEKEAWAIESNGSLAACYAASFHKVRGHNDEPQTRTIGGSKQTRHV